MTSFTISSDNKYFYILLDYFSKNGYLKKFRNFRLISNVVQGYDYNSYMEQNANVSLTIDNSTMFVVIHGRFFKISANTRTLNNSPILLTDLTLTTFGKSNKPYENLLKAALIFDKEQKNNVNRDDEFVDLTKPIVSKIKNRYNTLKYTNSYDKESIVYKTRSFENVFIKTSIKEKLIDRIDKFLKSRKFYDEHQIPYHFGLLMYGEPGTGKSSIIKALINYFDFSSVYYLKSEDIEKISNLNKIKGKYNYDVLKNEYISKIRCNLFGEDLNRWNFDSLKKNSDYNYNRSDELDYDYRFSYGDSCDIPFSIKVKKHVIENRDYSDNVFETYFNESYNKVYYDKNSRGSQVSVIIIEDMDTDLVANRGNSNSKIITKFEDYIYRLDAKANCCESYSDTVFEDDFVKFIVKRYFEKMKSDLNLSDKINLENIKSEVNVNIRSFFRILEFSITKFDENGRLKYNVFRLSFPKLKELYEKEFLQTVKTEEANDEIIKNNNNNRGTLSNILNSLDGLLASEDYIIIATTNHIDSIDPAILRPGRFDYKIEISSVEIEAYKQFCSKFYPNEVIPDDIIIENDISIASMQEIALSGASYEEFKSIFTVNKE